jgi:hypothetical protein
VDVEAEESAPEAHGKHHGEPEECADQTQGRAAPGNQPRHRQRRRGRQEQAEIRAAGPAQGNLAAGAAVGQECPVRPNMGEPRAVKHHRQGSGHETGDDPLPPEKRVDHQRGRQKKPEGVHRAGHEIQHAAGKQSLLLQGKQGKRGQDHHPGHGLERRLVPEKAIRPA